MCLWRKNRIRLYVARLLILFKFFAYRDSLVVLEKLSEKECGNNIFDKTANSPMFIKGRIYIIFESFVNSRFLIKKNNHIKFSNRVGFC